MISHETHSIDGQTYVTPYYTSCSAGGEHGPCIAVTFRPSVYAEIELPNSEDTIEVYINFSPYLVAYELFIGVDQDAYEHGFKSADSALCFAKEMIAKYDTTIYEPAVTEQINALLERQ